MNYYWRGENSTNSEGIAATAEWFQNMDMNSAIHGGIRRNTDGTIKMCIRDRQYFCSGVHTGCRLQACKVFSFKQL